MKLFLICVYLRLSAGHFLSRLHTYSRTTRRHCTFGCPTSGQMLADSSPIKPGASRRSGSRISARLCSGCAQFLLFAFIAFRSRPFAPIFVGRAQSPRLSNFHSPCNQPLPALTSPPFAAPSCILQVISSLRRPIVEVKWNPGPWNWGVRALGKRASRPGHIEKRAGHGRESILWLIRASAKAA